MAPKRRAYASLVESLDWQAVQTYRSDGAQTSHTSTDNQDLARRYLLATISSSSLFVEVNNLSKRHGLVGQYLNGLNISYPAAVTWPVKKRPKWFDASKTALYPAILAIELASPLASTTF
jgi:hypothetical protein